ncbi:hypothetical protein, partial [Limosilactobacillus reuteri]|uniref:hypothetical protein n=1 Tax=Limosilactobacillus reuteri TaxID=1598 RepID=UPI00207D6F95
NLTRDDEMAIATAWLLEHRLPLVGFVLLKNGVPGEWQHNKPRACSVMPGIVAVGIDGGGRFVATSSGAGRFWKAVP